jgi:hypothetical protein
MDSKDKENPNPLVYQVLNVQRHKKEEDVDYDEFDNIEVYGIKV